MIRKLAPYTKGYRVWIFLGVLCSAGEAVLELLLPKAMSQIVDVGIANGDKAYILAMGLKMILMALASLVMGVGAAALAAKAGMGFGANVRAAEYAQVQRFSFANIEHFSTASLITRLTNDVSSVQMTLMMGMRMLVRAPVMLITALVMALTISLQLSQVFLVVLPLLLLLVAIVIRYVGPFFTALQKSTDDLNLVVQENLNAIRVVKSFVREDYEEEKFAKRNGDLKESSMRAFGMVVINMPVMMLVVYSTIIAVMWFGGKMVYAGTLPVGDLTAFFTYITQILMSLMMVSMMFMMMTRSIACAKRIVEVLDERPAITDDSAKADAAVKDGSIDFDHVFFKYSETSPEWVLKDVNIHIPSGATVGILGGTGSGKPSIMSMIPRLYEAQEGTVSVGGRPVADYTMEHLRESVSVVLQKNTLFSGTIRENLLWGDPNATEDQLWAACRAARADEFLERMPDGLDTDLGQGGVNVSGGQKQRCACARALANYPTLLLADEPTGALDSLAAQTLLETFTEMNQNMGATILMVTHDAFSASYCSRILFLKDGRIFHELVRGEKERRAFLNEILDVMTVNPVSQSVE